MDRIRIDFFDILGYLIPGSALLMALWVAVDNKVISIWQIYNSIHALDKKTIFAALSIAYVAGFILHALGNFIYSIFLYKKIPKYIPSHVQNDWAFIREYGDKHIAILERWYALRALSQNLAAVSLVCSFICISKLWSYRYYEWLFTSISSLVLCFILLKRSQIFHNYLKDDIAAILKLDLDKNKVK